MYEGITFEDFLKVGGISARVPRRRAPGGRRDQGIRPPALLSPFPLQMWQGIDIETKMHVRFLNMETIAHCY